MLIIKDYKKAKERIKALASRFELSKHKKESKIVESILRDVRKRGDKALVYYTKKYDGVQILNCRVPISEINNSTKYVSKKLISSIRKALSRIYSFHKINIPKSWIKSFKLNEKMGYKYTPLTSVGIYIPGGKSPLISTVLMTVILAKVAGVKRIAVFSPPPIHKGILAACKLVGVNEVYQIGGAQAIAALAYGTESIKVVDKIVGPGNLYVTLAKRSVYGTVGIDGLYGPSEIAIIADKTACPMYVASDLLSQLEHGSGLESAVLITADNKLALQVQEELLKMVKNLPNKTTVLKSWNKNSMIAVVSNLNKATELINDFAPEHLEVITKKPQSLVKKLNNVGAIFLGEYSCEPVGDYVAGPSHCLPTGGTARFSSGLTVLDFVKKSSIISFDKKAFYKIAQDVINLADAEGLKAHGDAVRIRLNTK